MRVLTLLLALAPCAALPRATRAEGHWTADSLGGAGRATIDGRAETPDGVVPAVVKVTCRGGIDASVCVALKVEDAATVASFDFSAFAGEGAKAAGLPLFSGRVGAVAVDGPVSGREAPDPPGSFLFEFCGPSQGPSDAKKLAHAIAAGPGDVEIAIRHPAGDGRAIRAHVPADAPSGGVAGALKRCPADR
jgi:hypothetical protein